MAFKWLGGLLVLFAAGESNVWSVMQWRERLRPLGKPRQMTYLLKGEITYGHAPPVEGLECVEKRDLDPLGTLFAPAAEEICRQEKESLQEIRSRGIGLLPSPRVRLPFTDESLGQLTGLGEYLEYLGANMQERTLKLYLEQLDLFIDYSRTNQRRKCRLYTSFGIIGGMFLVIMMY